MKTKFVIAPDSFKESLNAFEAAMAMKEGIEKVYKDSIIEIIPMADGGEGTSDVIINAHNGEFKEVQVTGPLGRKTEARYGLIMKENIAVIETASACGLQLVRMKDRNPLYTTTFGVGEMILDAIHSGAKHLIIGLGGSSTNDGGLGMLQALGAKAYDIYGNELGLGGKELSKICNLDLSGLNINLKDVTIEAACDVENPLIGDNGATYTFAPQKGANEETLDKLEKGIDIVLKHTGFEEKVRNADYIFTGEGSIDDQTAYGKTISGIADRPKSLEDALKDGYDSIKKTSENIARLLHGV